MQRWECPINKGTPETIFWSKMWKKVLVSVSFSIASFTREMRQSFSREPVNGKKTVWSYKNIDI